MRALPVKPALLLADYFIALWQDDRQVVSYPLAVEKRPKRELSPWDG